MYNVCDVCFIIWIKVWMILLIFFLAMMIPSTEHWAVSSELWVPRGFTNDFHLSYRIHVWIKIMCDFMVCISCAHFHSESVLRDKNNRHGAILYKCERANLSLLCAWKNMGIIVYKYHVKAFLLYQREEKGQTKQNIKKKMK